jgi:hypothetical protein
MRSEGDGLMDPDLSDLLMAWLGGEVEPARRDELLARARRDEAFRRAFVAEVSMLGMLKAVQAAEPRWLQLEDELGWSAAEQAAGETLEDGIVRRLDARPGRRRLGPWGWAVAAAAAAALVAVALTPLLLRPREARKAPAPAQAEARPSPPRPKVDADHGLAVVVKLDGVEWEPADDPRPAEGDLLASGRLRFRSGRATLSMLTGVVFVVEGPADVELVSSDKVLCHKGKLRARVPEGAEGFVVSGPGSAVLDLGTEFGVNIEADGKTQGKVFEGSVEAAVLSASGTLRSSQVKRQSDAFEIDPRTGLIEAPTQAVDFVAPLKPAVSPLSLDASYPGAVLRSRPWGFWRFESMADGAVPNEVPGRPPLRVTGPVGLALASPGNRCAVFRPEEAARYLEMDGLWEPPRDPGYAVELWFLPEAIAHAALVSLIAPKDTTHHLSLVEVTSRNRLALYPPAAVRFLYRWPTGRDGGENLFSDDIYVPYRWHHLVAQVDGDRMELFVDGARASSLPMGPQSSTMPCQVLLGRLTTLTTSPMHPTGWKRSFAGMIDEFALYDHPLSAGEIGDHHRLAIPGARPE